MRLALISDVHANLEALEAVLSVIDERAPDAAYCAGDVVGYGADPAACLHLVRERCDGVVLGNHDEAVGGDPDEGFLPQGGRKVAHRHHEQLSDDERAYLRDLPPTLEAHGCTFVHATPDEPRAWRRLDSHTVAKEQFAHFDTDVCFVGHTHRPAVMADRLGVLRVRPGHRYLINVGSVGQPRDQNPRACVAFFDTDTFDYDLERVPYDTERAADKICEASLPDQLAQRLYRGK